ncbi:MAG: hypothetical protein FJW30_11130 [Acidobacteria bacterium]|nr:hypothetical protein [Acidobacteriota bacterium]
MPGLPSSVARWLLPVLFLTLASSAGLQWAGLSAQSEAARHHTIVQRLNDFSMLLLRIGSANEPERQRAAQQVSGYVDRLSTEEKLRAGSRRVTALASYPDDSVDERLRAEVRGLVSEAESLETAALRRANTYTLATQCLVVLTACVCGALLLRRKVPQPA